MSQENTEKPVRNSKSAIRLPIIISITLAAGVLLGSTFFSGGKKLTDVAKGYAKFREVLLLV
jgi:carboxyl-terminal processing protease